MSVGLPNLELSLLPKMFEQYHWNKKHALYGYPADTYPTFYWIKSLESRFAWLRKNGLEKTPATYLLCEMFYWGGNRNGEASKFIDGLGSVNLADLVAATISNLGSPAEAIRAAMSVPGMKLAYGSKFLRFLDPKNYGALDTVVCKTLNLDGSSTNPAQLRRTYVDFIEIARTYQQKVHEANIRRPSSALGLGTKWRIADIEMALFSRGVVQ